MATDIYNDVDSFHKLSSTTLASVLAGQVNKTLENAISSGGGGSIGSGNRHLTPGVQALLTLFYIFGVAGNVAALIMLKRQETQRNKRQTILLKCLAWNDLIALSGSAIQMYLQIYLPPKWVLTPYFCGVRVFWRSFGLGSGCVALAMAVERWFALTKPFFYQKNVTYHIIFRSILGLWILVIILSCLPFFGFGLYYDIKQIDYKKCSRFRFGTTPSEIAYAYIWFAYGLMMCVLITACNLGVIGALFKMKRRSETRSLKKRKLNCFDQSINGKQEESMGLRNDVAKAKVSVDRSNSTMTTASSRPSFRKREGSLAQNHAKEEVKFAILMAILCIFFVLCWLPQLVSIPIGLSNPTNQERSFFRIADVCIALNFVLDPYIYVLMRGKCGRWCCLLGGRWLPCNRKNTEMQSSLGLDLAKEDDDINNKLAIDPAGSRQGDRDRDYVPLKALLEDTTHSHKSQEHAV